MYEKTMNCKTQCDGTGVINSGRAPHNVLCFNSQNGSRVSKTEGFLGVDFLFCVRGVSFLTPLCTPPMQNAMFFHQK